MLSDYIHVADLTDDGFVVYEDPDGFRVLLTLGDLIPVHVWQQAYDEHNVSLIVSGHEGAAISTDEFVEERTEVLAQRSFRVERWRDFNFPTLREYYAGDSSEMREGSEPSASGLGTFVHLHTHTEYSSLDGLTRMPELFEILEEQGAKAVGTCDHGNCAGHPEQQAMADKHDIKPIFGMEAYFQPDRFRRTRNWMELDGVEVDPEHLSDEERKRLEKKSDSDEARWGYNHISLWAESQNGLRNLWAISTEGYRDGLFDGKPRIDWDTLTRLQDGVICGTGCLRGPVARPLVTCGCGHQFSKHDGSACTECSCLHFEGQTDAARDALMRLAAIFGDRLYVEIHCNTLDDQKKANEGLIALAREYGLPLVMAVDSHYGRPDQKVVHQMWIAMGQNKTLAEPTGMFEGDQHYHLMSEAEVRQFASYMPQDVVDEAIANTVVIAQRCTAEVRGESAPPLFTRETSEYPDHAARIQRDVDRMMEICLENWDRRTRGKPYSQQEAMDRLEREANLLVAKQFCGYFLIVWDYVMWAKGQGCLVGPSRGSGGGSFVAYLMGITEVDPIKEGLTFERFITEGRVSLPDFDIDFPTSWRVRVTRYIRDRWGGETFTSNIGTILRLRSKAAINDVARVLDGQGYSMPSYQEQTALKKLIDQADAPLAGKHMPWDEFCNQFASDIDPMRAEHPEFFLGVDEVVDRLKTYGKHAAGIVISPDRPLTDLPMRLTEITEVVDGKKVKEQMLVTQFDMNALELLGYTKFDILTLRTLDTLQECVDLIQQRLGKTISPYDWVLEYEDPQVWEQVSDGKTLGLFQVETAGGTKMIRRMQPSSLADLAAVVTVVRPGPQRSGLTDMFLRRRSGIEPVTYPDPRMENFVGETYGAMIYQEQVMACCMQLAGYDSTKADDVRSLLGKKKIEKVEAAGQEFRAMAADYGTDPQVAALLWDQMAEFAKYGFNKAHAFAYAMVGYWTAWLKFHFPVEFLLACMSTVDVDRIPEFVEECRMLGYGVRPPSINTSQTLFSNDGLDVVYGLLTVKGIGLGPAEYIRGNQPYVDMNDFLTRAVEPVDSPVNMGHVKALVEVGGFDEIVPNRRALEIELERDSSGESKRCVHRTDAVGPMLPAACGFDWTSEPDPPMIRKRVKESPEDKGKMMEVPKDPPKKCTIACRQYCKPPPIDPSGIIDYTTEEIMAKERDLLGTWISASPWDWVEEQHLLHSDTADAIERGPVEQQYLGVALVEEVKERVDSRGERYAFVTLNMQDGRVEPVCFSSVYSDPKQPAARNLTRDALGVAVLWKTPKGLQLHGFQPYPRTKRQISPANSVKEIAHA